MSDREDTSNLPPIPDGGLSDAMPDWLRRPPAWRALPDRDVSMPEPENDAELPEPDDSVIDPRTFLSDDDLPAWLKNLGHGRTIRAEGAGEDVVPEDAGHQPATETSRVDRRPEASPSRFVPATPPAVSIASSSNGSVRGGTSERPPSPAVSPSPAWQGAWIVALLAALLVVAIAVIVVLVL